MTSGARRAAVVLASILAVVALQAPMAMMAERLTRAVGAGLLLVALLGWGVIATVASGTFADHHKGLVQVVGLLLYLAALCALVWPAHFALRRHPRAHDTAVVVLALGFLLAMTFAWPVRGLVL